MPRGPPKAPIVVPRACPDKPAAISVPRPPPNLATSIAFSVVIRSGLSCSAGLSLLHSLTVPGLGVSLTNSDRSRKPSSSASPEASGGPSGAISILSDV